MSQGDGLWDPPYDPEFENSVLRALGWMVVQSNMLEHALADLCWVSSGKNWDEARDGIRGKTLGRIADLAIAEYERRFSSGELRQRLDAVKPALKNAIETRNQFVHAEWVIDHSRRVMHRRRLPRGAPGIREYLHFSVADLDAASDLVGSMATRLWNELYDPAEVATRPASGPRIL
jgi:hypothetical protein